MCLVTPLRDGMNLVAKEFVASQGNAAGVLVLSRFCGSAETMHDALMVNPYDIEGTALALRRALETLQEGPDGLNAQRQLMSGGVCEASAFARHGYLATGLAFPLGNYHNGAPEGRIEAEYIHIADYVAGVRLMVEAAHQLPERDDTGFQRRLRQVPDGFRDRLMATRLGHGRPEAQ